MYRLVLVLIVFVIEMEKFSFITNNVVFVSKQYIELQRFLSLVVWPTSQNPGRHLAHHYRGFFTGVVSISSLSVVFDPLYPCAQVLRLANSDSKETR